MPRDERSPRIAFPALSQLRIPRRPRVRIFFNRSLEPMSRHSFRFAAIVVLAMLAACKPSAPAADAPAKVDAPVAVAEATEQPVAPQAARPPDAAADAPVMPPVACQQTEAGGREFLNQFARSAALRKAYTAAAPQADAQPFAIALVDNRWVYADPALVAAEYPRVELKTSFSGNTFRIGYTRARFANDDETVEPYGETADYTFEFIDGCWKLVGHTPMR
jgi:hypothetical protein